MSEKNFRVPVAKSQLDTFKLQSNKLSEIVHLHCNEKKLKGSKAHNLYSLICGYKSFNDLIVFANGYTLPNTASPYLCIVTDDNRDILSQRFITYSKAVTTSDVADLILSKLRHETHSNSQISLLTKVNDLSGSKDETSPPKDSPNTSPAQHVTIVLTGLSSHGLHTSESIRFIRGVLKHNYLPLCEQSRKSVEFIGSSDDKQHFANSCYAYQSELEDNNSIGLFFKSSQIKQTNLVEYISDKLTTKHPILDMAIKGKGDVYKQACEYWPDWERLNIGRKRLIGLFALTAFDEFPDINMEAFIYRLSRDEFKSLFTNKDNKSHITSFGRRFFGIILGQWATPPIALSGINIDYFHSKKGILRTQKIKGTFNCKNVIFSGTTGSGISHCTTRYAVDTYKDKKSLIILSDKLNTNLVKSYAQLLHSIGKSFHYTYRKIPLCVEDGGIEVDINNTIENGGVYHMFDAAFECPQNTLTHSAEKVLDLYLAKSDKELTGSLLFLNFSVTIYLSQSSSLLAKLKKISSRPITIIIAEQNPLMNLKTRFAYTELSNLEYTHFVAKSECDISGIYPDCEIDNRDVTELIVGEVFGFRYGKTLTKQIMNLNPFHFTERTISRIP